MVITEFPGVKVKVRWETFNTIVNGCAIFMIIRKQHRAFTNFRDTP